jgi:hypothetical protein
VEIGSYPFVRDTRLGTSLVARHEDTVRLAQVKDALLSMIKDFNGEVIAE